MEDMHWLDWIVELQSLAQAGLAYSQDKYDLERFTRIQEITVEMLARQTSLPVTKVYDLFANERGYRTPKIDTRAAIFENDKILLVQEDNHIWSLPGGWCEVYLSVKENLIKEVKEEAGLDVEVKRLIALQDREKHNCPVYANKVCKIFALCENLGGQFVANTETLSSGYFSLDDLPILATEKNTYEQIEMCFAAYQAKEKWQTLID